MKIVYIANGGSLHFIRWYKYFISRGHDVAKGGEMVVDGHA